MVSDGGIVNGAGSSGRRTLFLTGMFDMANYGDLLFPLIAQDRLRRFGVDVVPVAPTAAAPALVGALPAAGIGTLFDTGQPCDGIAVGGGYLIHTHPLGFIETYDAGEARNWAGAGLWMGAALAAALRSVPLLWNAPGVLHPLGRRTRPLVDAALRMADYVSVRDMGSAEILAAPDDCAPLVVPDTVAGLASMWDKASLTPDLARFLTRKGVSPGARTLALHLRLRSVAGLDLGGIAASIERLAQQHNLLPVLIAVGQSHDDAALARRVSQVLAGPHVLLDDPLGLREITAVLANAAVYVGASLHGYVAAVAYGVPGVLVARPSYRKFAGFLDHTGRHGDLVRDWEQAWPLAARHLRENCAPVFPGALMQALDAHWQRIARSLTAPRDCTGPRLTFLSQWMQAGIAVAGPGWSMAPFVAGTDATETRAQAFSARKAALAQDEPAT